MFERSLVESRGLVGTATERWTALGSVALQCALAATLVAIPLLHPESLPLLTDAPKLFVPPAPRPPVPPVKVPPAVSTSNAMSVPAAVATVITSAVRSMLPTLNDPGPAPIVDTGISLFGPASGPPGSLAIATGANGPRIAVAPAGSGKLLNVSAA